jgi:hypothetical protein
MFKITPMLLLTAAQYRCPYSVTIPARDETPMDRECADALPRQAIAYLKGG